MPTPPQPPKSEDQSRWAMASKLYRMAYGLWSPDLERRVEKQVGGIRKEAWGEPDISANVFKAGWDAVAVLYDHEGRVQHEDPAAAARMAGLLEVSGFWPLWQTVQRDVLAMRELLVRVDIDRGEPVYRLVYPHWVTATARPQRPDEPVQVSEARLRSINGADVWTWDNLDSEAMSYTITDTEGEILESMSGDEYPYVATDGAAVLPYTMYHAKATNKLWDTWSTLELYEGSLNLGVKYTFLGHIERKAAWAQRYAIGVQIPGAGIAGDQLKNRRASVVTDPSTVLMLEAVEDNQSPQIGQWSTTVDIGAFTESISRYERRLASYIGLNAADIQRTSGDPRSGYALAVNRDSQRTLQRRYEKQFGKGDASTMRTIAILMNRWHAAASTPGWTALPESGYTMAYKGVPLSADERRAMQELHAARIEAGTMDIITAYQEQNPGTGRAEAMAALDQIRVINSSFKNASDPSRVEELQARSPGMSAQAARQQTIDAELGRLALESQLAATLNAAGYGAAPKSTIVLAPTDMAAIVSVNEARAQEGLAPVPGGEQSVFAAKMAATSQAAAPVQTPEDE